MPINWQELLQLAPLAMAKPGSPQAAAVLQGYQQSMQRLQQERLQREGVEAQRAQQAWQRDVQERQLSMQDQQHKAQLANTQADNTRADQAELRQKHQDALARLSQGIGAFTPAINQIAETATDPVQAGNALMQRAGAIGSAYGLDPSALSGFIPSMAPMVSAKKKKRARELYEEYTRTLGVEAMADESTTLRTGDDLFGDIKPSQLLEKFLPPAVTPDGAPIAPARPKRQRALQSKEMLVKGQLSAVNYDQETGEYFDQDGALVKASPVPPVPREPRAEEPLSAIIGPDGQPVFVPRSQAVGKRPASSRENGRPVPASTADDISELKTSIDDAAVLKTALGSKGATGARAKIGAVIPDAVTEVTGFGTSAKQRQATINRVKQVIGKALEGGVLRKEDEYKYTKILPTIQDPPEVAASKLAGLEAALRLKLQRKVEALTDAGYDTGRFERPAATPAAADPMGIR